MTDVFISYSRQNAVSARAAATALRERGFEVWLDNELPAHGSFADEIDRRISDARAVLAIWSEDAVRSEWVRAEANRGREARKLVQISLDTAVLPLPFDQIQCLRMDGWRGDVNAPEWGKVVESLATLVGKSGGLPKNGAIAATEARAPLLAVLAFDNVSDDPQMDFFCDGVAEEIQQTLSRAAGLKTVARSSAFQFRGAQKAVRRVASELQVSHLLDGSVRRSGQRVRITAHLIDCASETSLWSERFDRSLDDIFALQDEIAAAVAHALRVVFSPPAVSREMDLSTYDLFLKAQSIISEGGGVFDDAAAAAAPLLEQVVREAPHHARGWELLANARVWILRSGRRQGSYADGRAGVVEAAETALRLDPTRGRAFEALAMLEPWGAYEARQGLLERALYVSPNEPSVLTAMSSFYWGVGRFRDALSYAERASELNPLLPSAGLAMAQLRTYVGDQAASIRMLEELHRRWPNNFAILETLLSNACSLGFWDSFRAAVGDTEHFDGWQASAFKASVRFADALRSEAPEPRLRLLEQCRRLLKDTGTLPLNFITMLCHLDLADDALDLAERASFAHMSDPDGPMPSALYPGTIFGPWSTLNQNPRFIGVCDRLGLCAYWAQSQRWPDMVDWAPYDLKKEATRLANA